MKDSFTLDAFGRRGQPKHLVWAETMNQTMQDQESIYSFKISLYKIIYKSNC